MISKKIYDGKCKKLFRNFFILFINFIVHWDFGLIFFNRIKCKLQCFFIGNFNIRIILNYFDKGSK